jgi:hypothetical protein
MSGASFEYNQYHIHAIAEEIEGRLLEQGKPIKDDSPWMRQYYRDHPEEAFHYIYPVEVQEKIVEAVMLLRMAYVYAHRLDRLFSGDDGNENFLARLEKELSSLPEPPPIVR